MIERDGFGRAAVVPEVSRSAPQLKYSASAAMMRTPKTAPPKQPKQQPKEEKQEDQPPTPPKENKMATKTAAPIETPIDPNQTDPTSRDTALTHQSGTKSTTSTVPAGSGGGANTSGTGGPQPAPAPAKSSSAGLLAGGLVLAYFLLK